MRTVSKDTNRIRRQTNSLLLRWSCHHMFAEELMHDRYIDQNSFLLLEHYYHHILHNAGEKYLLSTPTGNARKARASKYIPLSSTCLGSARGKVTSESISYLTSQRTEESRNRRNNLICRCEITMFIAKNKGAHSSQIQTNPSAQEFLPDQETDRGRSGETAAQATSPKHMASKVETCTYTRRQGERGGGRSVSPCGHRERTNSLSAVTVVAGSYLLGPMSVPSNSRNLTSIGSFPPAIFPAGRVKAQDPNNRSGDRWPAQSTTAGGGIGGGKNCRIRGNEGKKPMRIPRSIRFLL